MSDELLRRAAAKLREHVNPDDLNTRRPWCPEYAWHAIRHVERNVDLDIDPCPDHDDMHGGFGRYAGKYIALMHPPVALALAKWLEDAADDAWDMGSGQAAIECARAILREPS